MRDLWLDLLEEWRAALGLGIVVAALVGYILVRQSRPTEFETAKIIRFGSYANDTGDHPSVTASTTDGASIQVFTIGAPLGNCVVGGQIRLVRKPHSVSVDPRGCR